MPRKSHTWNYIYKTSCNITGRYYIGMHSTSNLEDGYMGSGKRLGYSIKKYGRENHTKVILEWLPDRSSLKIREKEIVNEDMLNDLMCMNMIIGGEGGRGFTAEEQKLNAKKSNEKQKILREDPEWVKRKSIKMSESLNSQYESGKRDKKYFYDWNGKTHTEESKQLMRDKAKERIGDKNSQFGTCWITNGIDSIKINKGDLIPENWKLGRKIKK